MNAAIEELRTLTAGRLMDIRRGVQADGTEEWAVAAECNARILAECCYTDGERVFSDSRAVLDALTFREMESLICRMAGVDPVPKAQENPCFDMERFRRLKEG